MTSSFETPTLAKLHTALIRARRDSNASDVSSLPDRLLGEDSPPQPLPRAVPSSFQAFPPGATQQTLRPSMMSVISLGDEMPSWLPPLSSNTESQPEDGAAFVTSVQTTTTYSPTPPRNKSPRRRSAAPRNAGTASDDTTANPIPAKKTTSAATLRLLADRKKKKSKPSADDVSLSFESIATSTESSGPMTSKKSSPVVSFEKKSEPAVRVENQSHLKSNTHGSSSSSSSRAIPRMVSPLRRSRSLEDGLQSVAPLTDGSSSDFLRSVSSESARLADLRKSATSDDLEKTGAGQSLRSQSLGSKGFFQRGLSVLRNKAPVTRSSPIGSLPKDSLDNAVIIFDWDDTLCPTTYIKQVVDPKLPTSRQEGSIADSYYDCSHRLLLPLAESPHFQKFRKNALVVEAVLREARKVARVAIVTLATKNWVDISAERYFPGIDVQELWRELDVEVYHCDRQSPLVQAIAASGRDPCLAAKKAAMSKCLKRIYDDSDLPWNVLSVGDMITERDAVKECLAGTKRAICKTIKFRENLPIDDLTKDLQLLIPNLIPLASHQKNFDRTMANLNSKPWNKILGI